jgi:diguanylate cyclase (GGDEF)-like protein
MTLRPNLNSLTTRLILIGMVLIVFGAFARIFLLSDYLRHDVVELTSAQLSTIAGYVAKDVDHDIVDRQELLERVATRLPLGLLNDGKQLQQWLGDRHDINPLFSQGLFVLDTAGVVLADYPATSDRVGLSYADRDYFQQALKGDATIGRPVVGRVAKVPVLPMARPLRDASGSVRAVLVGVSSLQSPNFMSALYSTRVGATGSLVLVSPRDKLFVGASGSDIALTPTPQPGSQAQHDAAMTGKRGTGIWVNASGVEELAATASVPSSGWFVVARMPATEVYAPLDRLRVFIQSNTAIAIPVFLLLMVLVLRHLMRPLMNAARHADRMTHGEIPFEPLPVVRDDEVGHLTAAFNRVLSKLIESRAELEHMAHHDALTGLPNRQLLMDRMAQSLARAERHKGSIAVLFLDLDGFKPINDRFGHEAGDDALRQVAQRLAEAVRREDTLARIGGDEFVILLSDIQENPADAAALVAVKCLEVFAAEFMVHGQACRLGTSIGIAVGNDPASAEKLLIAADQAMYRAKESGRGKYCCAA